MVDSYDEPLMHGIDVVRLLRHVTAVFRNVVEPWITALVMEIDRSRRIKGGTVWPKFVNQFALGILDTTHGDGDIVALQFSGRRQSTVIPFELRTMGEIDLAAVIFVPFAEIARFESPLFITFINWVRLPVFACGLLQKRCQTNSRTFR